MTVTPFAFQVWRITHDPRDDGPMERHYFADLGSAERYFAENLKLNPDFECIPVPQAPADFVRWLERIETTAQEL